MFQADLVIIADNIFLNSIASVNKGTAVIFLSGFVSTINSNQYIVSLAYFLEIRSLCTKSFFPKLSFASR